MFLPFVFSDESGVAYALPMPLQCNIDSKGKAIRLVNGTALLAVGAALALLWAWPSGSVWAWIVCGAMWASGGFSIFEGWSGWCVVRALGFRTRI
jgi:hypothetical protein